MNRHAHGPHGSAGTNERWNALAGGGSEVPGGNDPPAWLRWLGSFRGLRRSSV